MLVDPLMLPHHTNPAAIALNRRSLRASLQRRLGRRPPRLSVLASLPTARPYIDALPADRVAYLRLDDYADLPGVDRDLVERTEPALLDRADAVLVTARALTPPRPWAAKTVYLPQGVDVEHFARLSLESSRQPVLGFFGLLAEWVDFGLIRDVAGRLPEWRLELLGPIRHLPDDVLRLPNVVHRPACPYERLPEAIAHWAAAWTPFQVAPVTIAMNPLKVREYLAAGLPTHCTPLPEAEGLGADVLVTADPGRIAAWAREALAGDAASARAARRAAMIGETWHVRAAMRARPGSRHGSAARKRRSRCRGVGRTAT